MQRQQWPDTNRRAPLVPSAPPAFKSPSKPARVAVWLLRAAIAALLVIAVLDVVNVVLLSQAIGDAAVYDDRVELRDTLMWVTVALWWGSFLPAAIAVMVWMTRAYRNVDALAREYKRHWTGWAWLGWIVPIIALFRPKQVVNDMWRASSYGDLPGWLAGWWALWIGSAIASRVTNRLPADTIEQLRWFDGVDVVMSLAFAGSALLTIRLVRTITDKQEEHSRRPPPEPDRDGRTAGGEIPEGFTIKPAWAPSESA